MCPHLSTRWRTHSCSAAHPRAQHSPLPSTLIMHLQADPSPASHFLPLGYSATPPLPSSSRLLSLPQRLPTTHHHQPHPLTPSFCQPRIWRPRGATDSLPVASRSWAEREGPPAAAWNTHPPVSILPLPARMARRGSTRRQSSKTPHLPRMAERPKTEMEKRQGQNQRQRLIQTE